MRIGVLELEVESRTGRVSKSGTGPRIRTIPRPSSYARPAGFTTSQDVSHSNHTLLQPAKPSIPRFSACSSFKSSNFYDPHRFPPSSLTQHVPFPLILLPQPDIPPLLASPPLAPAPVRSWLGSARANHPVNMRHELYR